MSSESRAISVSHVTKQFRIVDNQNTATTLREALVERFRHPLAGSIGRRRFTALDDVSFEIGQGEILGLIGGNGAGKTTLLKVLTRISTIDRGRIEVRGRVGSLLEVGTGFHPDLTGRENIFLNGTILGMGQAEIRRRLDEIVAFAEVDEFLDTPVKRYSSGMAVRLAFSVAIHFDAEILLVDEVLAVGDAAFQRRCVEKIQEVALTEGRTVIFVSHNMAPVRTMCHRALVLAGGRILYQGDPAAAINAYLGANASAGSFPGRWDLGGRGEGLPLRSLTVLGADAHPTSHLQTGEAASFLIRVGSLGSVRRPVVGLRLTGGGDFPVSSTTTPAGLVDRHAPADQEVNLSVPVLPLAPGRYGVDVWVGEVETWSLCDMVVRAGWIEVESAANSAGQYRAIHGDGAVVIEASWMKGDEVTLALSTPVGSPRSEHEPLTG